MDDLLYYSQLFDFYGALLTEKQSSIFKDYFFENLTIEEIACNNGVSKNAISKTIKAIKAFLVEYENSIGFKKYVDSIKKEFQNDDEILKRIEKYDNINI